MATSNCMSLQENHVPALHPGYDWLQGSVALTNSIQTHPKGTVKAQVSSQDGPRLVLQPLLSKACYILLFNIRREGLPGHLCKYRGSMRIKVCASRRIGATSPVLEVMFTDLPPHREERHEDPSVCERTLGGSVCGEHGSTERLKFKRKLVPEV